MLQNRGSGLSSKAINLQDIRINLGSMFLQHLAAFSASMQFSVFAVMFWTFCSMLEINGFTIDFTVNLSAEMKRLYCAEQRGGIEIRTTYLAIGWRNCNRVPVHIL
jgi:hypothetical protein